MGYGPGSTLRNKVTLLKQAEWYVYGQNQDNREEVLKLCPK